MTRGGSAALAVLAAVVVALGLSSCAQPADTARVNPTSPSATAAAARAAGERALALVTVPAELGFELEFEPAGADSPRARTDLEGRRITVFVRPGDASHRIAHDIAHEYGHAWDAVHMTAGTRAAYLRARGVPDAEWWPRRASDYATGAGDFAEVFAACRAASPEFRSRLAPAPADPCAMLLRAAG